MLKRSIAWVLVLALLVSVMPQLSLGATAVETATPPAAHSHAQNSHVCEDEGCGYTSEWEKWGDTPEEKGSVPVGVAGETHHYYLVDNITITNPSKSDGDSEMVDGAEVVICLNGYTIDGNEKGTIYRILGTSKLTISDCTAYEDQDGYHAGVIKNGKKQNVGGAFFVNNNGRLTMHDGMIQGNKNVQTSTALGYGGGAIAIRGNGYVELNNVTLTGNTTTREGGAICMRDSTATLIAKKCTFINNESTKNGGAIYSQSGSTITLEECTFTNNVSTTMHGGAIYSNNGGTITLKKCDFTKNKACRGSAVFAINGSANMTECTFKENQCLNRENTNAEGGGTVRLHGVTSLMDRCTFADNTAENNGGSAIYTTAGNTNLTLKDCTITNNNFTGTGTGARGAVYITDANDKLTVSGSTVIQGNYAAYGSSNQTERGVFLQRQVQVDIGGLTENASISIRTETNANGWGNIAATASPSMVTAKTAPTSWNRMWVIYENNGMAVDYNATESFHFAKATDHIHCECGVKDCTVATHEEIEYMPWTSGNSLPASGDYYLTTNVELTEDCEVSSDLRLCLEGHTITQKTEGQRVITHTGGELLITDCKSSGIITGGKALTGGGIQTEGGTAKLKVYNITFSGNAAIKNGDNTGFGGAIFVNDSAEATVTNVTFTNNDAYNGGGICVRKDGKLTVNGGKLDRNTSTKDGAGLYLHAGTVTTLTDTVFTGNDSSGAGGGISFSNTATATLNNVTFNGRNESVNGGAMIVQGTSKVTVNGGLIEQNTSTGNGGAIYVSSELTLNGTTIQNNTASKVGGGVYVAPNGNLTLNGASITNNTASGNGGGIYVHTDAKTMHVEGNTVIKGNTSNNLYLAGQALMSFGTMGDQANIGISVAENLVRAISGTTETDPTARLFSDADKRTVTYSEKIVYVDAGGEHKHCVCDGAIENCEHGLVNWAAWEKTDSLPTSGNYYLTAPVTLAAEALITGDLNLCLNGMTVTAAGGKRIFSTPGNGDVDVVITDCLADTTPEGVYTAGMLTNGSESNDNQGGGAIYIKKGDSLTLYEGKITGNTTINGGGAILLGKNSKFTMYGGEIAHNTAKKADGTWNNGGAIYGLENVDIRILDGTIKNNGANNGGGIYINSVGKLTVSGGMICENTAAKSGGGIYAAKAAITITGGTISGNISSADGAGVYAREGNMEISGDVLITDNESKQAGGGVCYSGQATGTISGGVIEKNNAVSGGGMMIQAKSNVTITDVTIQGNTAVGEAGGIRIHDATVEISGGSITKNSAKKGGGISAEGNAVLTIAGGEVSGNTANEIGGGIYATNATLTMTGGAVANNTSVNQGGGMYNTGSEVTLTAGTVSGNQSGKDGAGVYINKGNMNISEGMLISGNVSKGVGGGVCYSTNATGTISGATIEKNTAGGSGAGMIIQAKANVLITDVTIQDNVASSYGGGIYVVDSTLKMTGGEIAGNTAKKNGSGVYVNAASTLALEGAPVILANANNTNLYLESGVLMQAGAMAEGARVSVSADLGQISAKCKDVSAYFVSDSGYRKAVYQNGALYLVAGGEHQHCVCDSTIADCDHGKVNWAAWEKTDSLPASGNYYLIYDVTLTKENTISGDLNLCLNGHTVTAAKDKRIFKTPDAANTGVDVAITDCTAVTTKEGAYYAGKLTGGAEANNEQGGGAVYIKKGDTLKLYEGMITGNTTINGGGAILLAADTVFTMYGGEISNNIAGSADGKTLKNGGAIYGLKNADIRILGGTIKKNAANSGGGIYIDSAGKLTVAGGVIAENTAAKNGGGIYLYRSEATLSGGQVSGNTAVNGGGILCEGGTVYLKGANVIKNLATENGGGVKTSLASKTYPATVVMSGGTISENAAALAGGVLLEGSGSKMTMTGGEVSKNTASGEAGGVYASTNTIWTMQGGKISGNTANTGGGVVLYRTTATFTGGELSGNKAVQLAQDGKTTGGHGGAVYVAKESKVSLSGCKITGNTADNSGGGIYTNGTEAVVTIDGCEVSGNQAKNGGAILMATRSHLAFVSGKVTGNTATSNGGGMYISTNTTFDMTGGQVSGNKANGSGGGIYLLRAVANLSGGQVSGNEGVYGGGGILCKGSTLNLKGTDIIQNTTSKNGGGIKTGIETVSEKDVYVSKVVMSTGLISGNAAALGGGILLEGAGSEMTMSGGEISQNTVSDSAGGVWVSTKAVWNMEGGKITGNTANNGGGIVVFKAAATFTGGEISGNKAKTNAGGAYIRYDSTSAEFQNVTIVGNSATNGGGVLVSNGATLVMKSGKVSGNTTTKNGAGMYISTDSGLKMSGGSVTGNTAESAGGGIYGLQATMTLSGGSVSNNSAYNGGGIHNSGGDLYLYGTAVTGNKAEKGVGGGVNTARRVVKKNGVEISYPARIVLNGSAVSGNTAKTGGGIVMSGNGGAMEMHSGTISNNISAGSCGGLYVSAKCTLTMTGGRITGNEAESAGGGVYHNKATVSYTGGEIDSNISGTAGGGMYFTSNCVCDMKNVSIHDNAAGTVGGAAYINNDSIFTVSDSQFADNTAGTRGGALYGAPGAALTAANTSFTGNTAVELGGALCVRDTADLTDCSLTDNKAEKGGAVYAGNTDKTYAVNGWGTKGSEVGVVVKSCTISDNHATSQGGGLYLTMSAFTDMQDTVITGNTSGAEGSGIWAEDDLTMINVTVTGNTSENGGYAVYLSDSEYDGQTYIKGLMKMGGDMIINNNQGGDMFLGNLVTVMSLSQGYGEKTNVCITLDSGLLTQRVFGSYNYEGGNCVYTITYGDRSMTEPEYAEPVSEETGPTEGTEGTETTEPANKNTLLYAGVGAFAVVIVAIAVIVVLVNKKKKAGKSATEVSQE